MAVSKRRAKRKPAKTAKMQGSGHGGGHLQKAGTDDILCSSLTLFILTSFFSIYALALYYGVIPQKAILPILVLASIIWFAFEAYLARGNWQFIKRAILVGIFLLAFDFVFENSGWIFGLWATRNTVFAIGVVPIEVMLICLIGGAAWAMYLPKGYDKTIAIMDILTFAAFGALGEYLLGINGMMMYYQWWNSGWAFMAYAFTWLILQAVRYSVFRVGAFKKLE